MTKLVESSGDHARAKEEVTKQLLDQGADLGGNNVVAGSAVFTSFTPVVFFEGCSADYNFVRNLDGLGVAGKLPPHSVGTVSNH